MNFFFFFFQILEEALEANDLITDAFQKYQQLVLKQQPNINRNDPNPDSCLIPNMTAQSSKPQNTMDELNEIFSGQGNEAGALLTPTIAASLDLLEPSMALSGDFNLEGRNIINLQLILNTKRSPFLH